MKLYNMNLSNFATKSRIVIFEKGLNIEMSDIPGGNPKSSEYLKVNPLGKIPSLDADGTMILESEIINEYLEEKFPIPALLPKTPEARAHVRLLTRLHDLYLDPPLRALFGHLNPKNRDEKIVNEKLSELQGRLDLPRDYARIARQLRHRFGIHAGRLRLSSNYIFRNQYVARIRRQAAARKPPQVDSVVDQSSDSSLGKQSPRRNGRGAQSHDGRLSDPAEGDSHLNT